MRRSVAGAMCALVLVLAAVNVAAGQRGARAITGTVMDSANHKPLSQAGVYLGRMPAGQRTGNDGKFSVSAPPDALLLLVRRSGYVPVIVEVPADTVVTDVGAKSLRQVKTDEDRAAVENADVRMYPELAQFYDHKKGFRQGVFLAPDELSRLGGSLFTLIRQKPGFHFICIVTRRGDVDCGQEANRGRTSILDPHPTSREQEPCVMHVWTNALGPQHTLDEILMEDVLAVEAFPTPGVTPSEFAGSPCATIMLWMRHSGAVTARP
ncbi:MAG TPA: hypothetical protein VKC15_08705 [Gemmatimonadales bacterium]|nr:hypothetical protein [Gemmatimonadales bacterium]